MLVLQGNTGAGTLISPHDRHSSSATGGHASGMTATQSHSGQPSLWVHRLLQKATGLGFPSQSGHGFVSSWRGSSPAGRAWLGSGSGGAACGRLSCCGSWLSGRKDLRCGNPPFLEWQEFIFLDKRPAFLYYSIEKRTKLVIGFRFA